MKKILIIIILSAFVIGNLQAQFKVVKPVKSTQKLNTVIPPTQTPPPVMSKTTAPISKTEVTPSVYSLTSARVNIKTGNDNKEFPSGVVVWLISKGVGYALEQPVENLRNEMKINSNTEFGLQNSAVNGSNESQAKLLESFQKEGLILRIRYFSNWPTDAWKIEGVTLTLEFKDQFGNSHPQYGNKTIVFNNANGYLNTWDKDMECTADANFNPLTSSIQK